MIKISKRAKGKIARAVFVAMFVLLIGTVGSMEVFEMGIREGIIRMCAYIVIGTVAGMKGGIIR